MYLIKINTIEISSKLRLTEALYKYSSENDSIIKKANTALTQDKNKESNDFSENISQMNTKTLKAVICDFTIYLIFTVETPKCIFHRSCVNLGTAQFEDIYR